MTWAAGAIARLNLPASWRRIEIPGDRYRKVGVMIRNAAVRVIVLCALVYSPVLPAQNPSVAPTTGGTESTTNWCFPGRPKPRRDVFWLPQVGAALPLSANPHGVGRGGVFRWGR